MATTIAVAIADAERRPAHIEGTAPADASTLRVCNEEVVTATLIARNE